MDDSNGETRLRDEGLKLYEERVDYIHRLAIDMQPQGAKVRVMKFTLKGFRFRVLATAALGDFKASDGGSSVTGL